MGLVRVDGWIINLDESGGSGTRVDANHGLFCWNGRFNAESHNDAWSSRSSAFVDRAVTSKPVSANHGKSGQCVCGVASRRSWPYY